MAKIGVSFERMAGIAWVAAAVMGLGPIHAEAAGSWVRAKMARDSTVRAAADPSSEALGTYRIGSPILIYDTGNAEWYAIAFSQPVKGKKSGWVLKADVEMGKGASASHAGSRKKTAKPSGGDDWIGLIFEYSLPNPTAYLTAVGETGKSSGAIQFGGEWGRKFWDDFLLSLRFSYYTFSGSSTATNISKAYFASGMIFSVGGGYILLNSPSFQLMGGGRLGLSLSSAGNETVADVSSTTQIMEPWIAPGVSARLNVGENIDIRPEISYRIFSLKSVLGVTQGRTEVIAPFDLSGIGFSLGVSYSF